MHVPRPDDTGEILVSPIACHSNTPYITYVFLRCAGQLLMAVLANVLSQACCSQYHDYVWALKEAGPLSNVQDSRLSTLHPACQPTGWHQ